MNKKVTFLLATVVVVIISYNLMGQIFSALKSSDRLTQALDELYKLEVKNKQLKKELEQVKSPQFLEKQARNKLGLAKEGETVVIIPQEKIEAILGLSKKIEDIKLPNPLGWLKLFFH